MDRPTVWRGRQVTSVRGTGRFLLALLLLLSTGCGKQTIAGSTDPRAIARAAKQVDKPVTTAQSLFVSNAPIEKWEDAFAADPGDTTLYEAFIYRELLTGNAGNKVEEALTTALTAKVDDPWLRFLHARQAWLTAQRSRQDQAVALKNAADKILADFKIAEDNDRDNAFYYYQEAAFQLTNQETGKALTALSKGNAAARYQHPFGVPFPPAMRSLDELVPGMGASFGGYFQTSPRFFLTDLSGQLKQFALQYASNDQFMAEVLRCARRQLVMEPFDMVSYQAALGLNRELWQEYGIGPHAAAAKAVITKVDAFNAPLKLYANQNDVIAKKLRTATDNPQLTFGAAMLAAMNKERKTLGPLEKDLLETIDANLPAASGVSQ